MRQRTSSVARPTGVKPGPRKPKADPTSPSRNSRRSRRDAAIGEQIEGRTAWLNEGQPHLCATFHARHLDAGLKARAGRRWPEGWQHCILALERGDATRHTRTGSAANMSDSGHIWNRFFARGNPDGTLSAWERRRGSHAEFRERKSLRGFEPGQHWTDGNP
jgi:hypothetical protein